ncbi:MAG: membrane integrity-associated transporter subunit PqiC [Planctomycetes bacterium]|nr:membrane integrity-associated transporter subunit PqiC [Planctomycetota bacterium]
MRTLILLTVAIAAAACGSVEVPTDCFYRLQLPAAKEADPMRAGTLRVHDLQLGTALDSDRLLRQSGVRLEPRPLSRWVAPLDRLVTDAMVLGLSRARVCDLVKGSADAGVENWSLHGRIVDFVEADGPAGAEARVRLELWLQQGDAVVFQDEFASVEAIAAAEPDAAVAALSRALNRIVVDVVGRMRSLDLFAAAHAERAASAVARPPR